MTRRCRQCPRCRRPPGRARASGTANDWAIETYSVSKVNTYGPLPAPGAKGVYTLPASYVKNAKGVVATQLSKAGVRLAFVLNDALK